ncbi:MAG: hypothetical protein WBM90_02075, partial [Acidimicrobiia bacterium]
VGRIEHPYLGRRLEGIPTAVHEGAGKPDGIPAIVPWVAGAGGPVVATAADVDCVAGTESAVLSAASPSPPPPAARTIAIKRTIIDVREYELNTTTSLSGKTTQRSH